MKRRLAAEQDAAAQATLRDELRQQEEYLAEIRSLELTLPDLTFDKSLILHRPDRDVVLLFLGRGHTSGDVVAYLPKQRVVATGDLLHGWMPFMGDSYPPEWVATLDALDKLDFDHIIGGHGGVKPRAHLRFFRNYLADLIAEVRRAPRPGRVAGAGDQVGRGGAGAEVRGRHGRALRRVGRRKHREGLQGSRGQALLNGPGLHAAGQPADSALQSAVLPRWRRTSPAPGLLGWRESSSSCRPLRSAARAVATFAAAGADAPAWLRDAMASGLLISGTFFGAGLLLVAARRWRVPHDHVDVEPTWPWPLSSGSRCWLLPLWRPWRVLDCRHCGDESELQLSAIGFWDARGAAGSVRRDRADPDLARADGPAAADRGGGILDRVSAGAAPSALSRRRLFPTLLAMGVICQVALVLTGWIAADAFARLATQALAAMAASGDAEVLRVGEEVDLGDSAS